MKIKLKIAFLIIGLFFSIHNVNAVALTFVSDTISSSIPGASSNHTIRFTNTKQIPINGKIIIKPQINSFKIPTLFSITDIDMSINGVEQTLAMFPSPTNVGVEIVTGINGSFSFTLSSAVSPSGEVVVKFGKNANVGGIGTKQIKNPLSIGSYRMSLESKNAINIPIDSASAMTAILFPVQVGTAPSLPISAEKSLAFEPDILNTITLTNTNNTQFIVTAPAGVVEFLDEVLLHISAFDKIDTQTIAPTVAGKSQIGKAYELSMIRLSDETTVTGFSENVTFDMYYNDSDISGIDESSLKINKWNGTAWLPVVGSTVYTSENRASAQVSSFSFYTIIGDVSSSSPPVSNGGNSSGSRAITTINEVDMVPETLPEKIINSIKDTFNNLIGKNDTIPNKVIEKPEEDSSLFDILSSPTQSPERNKWIKIALIFIFELLILTLLAYLWKRFRR